MFQDAREHNLHVAFFDPQPLLLYVIGQDRHFAVRGYVERALALAKFLKKELIIFPCKTGGHWIVVIISMKWRTVWYLDSQKEKSYNSTMLSDLLDW